MSMSHTRQHMQQQMAAPWYYPPPASTAVSNQPIGLDSQHQNISYMESWSEYLNVTESRNLEPEYLSYGEPTLSNQACIKGTDIQLSFT